MKRLDNGDPVHEFLPSQTNSLQQILVADDDPTIRRCSAEALMQAGYSVDAVGDGEAAWEALNARSYDLLVTDYMIPKLSGVELCRKLRAARMALPVILMSGTLPKEELEQHAWLKFAALLPKPFSQPDLLARINEILGAPGEVRNHKGAWFPFPIAYGHELMPSSRWGINE